MQAASQSWNNKPYLLIECPGTCYVCIFDVRWETAGCSLRKTRIKAMYCFWRQMQGNHIQTQTENTFPDLEDNNVRNQWFSWGSLAVFSFANKAMQTTTWCRGSGRHCEDCCPALSLPRIRTVFRAWRKMYGFWLSHSCLVSRATKRSDIAHRVPSTPVFFLNCFPSCGVVCLFVYQLHWGAHTVWVFEYPGRGRKHMDVTLTSGLWWTEGDANETLWICFVFLAFAFFTSVWKQNFSGQMQCLATWDEIWWGFVWLFCKGNYPRHLIFWFSVNWNVFLFFLLRFWKNTITARALFGGGGPLHARFRLVVSLASLSA